MWTSESPGKQPGQIPKTPPHRNTVYPMAYLDKYVKEKRKAAQEIT